MTLPGTLHQAERTSFAAQCLHTHTNLIRGHVDWDTMRSWTLTTIDNRLLEQARKLGRHRTKEEAVNAALEEYVRKREQQKILSLFGKIGYESAYDYKRERKSKRA